MATPDSGARRRLFTDLTAAASLIVALVVVVQLDRLALLVPVPSVDLVFLLDEGRSMSAQLNAMRNDCLEKAKQLHANGVDCQFAIISFGCADDHVTHATTLTADLNEFRKQVTESSPISSEHVLHSGIDALDQALGLPFRNDSTVLFFLVSVNPVHSGDPVGKVASRMRERGIVAIIQASASEEEVCRDLYQNGGRFFSLDGQDLTVSTTAASNDSSEVVLNMLSASAHTAAGQDATSLLEPGLYEARTRADRGDWIHELGGSRESEKAVAAGLDWLARHQAVDGHWSDKSQCDGTSCSSLNYSAALTAQTGLAVLAFQAGGHYAFNGQKYSENVRRGLDWLVERQKPDGCLFDRHTWYEHGIATFALAEACAVARAECRIPAQRYEKAANQAVGFLEKHQYAQGGWRYDLGSQGRGDTSVTGWQILALKSAREAKIDIVPETMVRVLKFFDAVGDPKTGHTGYTDSGRHTDLTTAVGLVVQNFFVKEPNSSMVLKAAKHLEHRAQYLGQRGDFYTLYNSTLAMFLTGGDAWTNWNDAVRDAVLQRQEQSGCQHGSWSGKYGRTLATAWAVLTLEVYYRYATNP